MKKKSETKNLENIHGTWTYFLMHRGKEHTIMVMKKSSA